MLSNLRVSAFVIAAFLSITACGQAESTGAAPAAVAAPPGPPLPIDERLSTADAAKGKVLFLQCRACHSLEEAGSHKVGPNLWGFMGRKAGLAPGFNYSEVMAQSPVVWTPEALDHWLERPSEFMPGNRMVFVGIRKPDDRANLIAYLLQETGAAQPAPVPATIAK